jgi:hypothetical protein
MDRRTFLRGAAVLGSGVLAGAAAAACSTSGGQNASGGGSTSTTEHGPPDWSKLAGTLGGTLLIPTDNGFAAAGHL